MIEIYILSIWNFPTMDKKFKLEFWWLRLYPLNCLGMWNFPFYFTIIINFILVKFSLCLSLSLFSLFWTMNHFFFFFFWKISLFMKLMPQILEKILKTIISFPFFTFSFFYSFCKIKNPFLSFSLCFLFFFFLKIFKNF